MLADQGLTAPDVVTADGSIGNLTGQEANQLGQIAVNSQDNAALSTMMGLMPGNVGTAISLGEALGLVDPMGDPTSEAIASMLGSSGTMGSLGLTASSSDPAVQAAIDAIYGGRTAATETAMAGALGTSPLTGAINPAGNGLMMRRTDEEETPPADDGPLGTYGIYTPAYREYMPEGA